jgi:hypothetical protein
MTNSLSPITNPFTSAEFPAHNVLLTMLGDRIGQSCAFRWVDGTPMAHGDHQPKLDQKLNLRWDQPHNLKVRHGN